MPKRSSFIISLKSYKFAFLLLIAYTFFVYYRAESKTVVLPQKSVPICLVSNQANDDLRKTLTEAILNAKKSITCIIYSLSDEEMIHALKTASLKGVDVFIVCDAVATQDAASKLGPKVRLHPVRRKGLMHNKLISIDQKQAWLGSSNFTRDSLMVHANLVLGIESEEVALAIEEKAKLLSTRSAKKVAPIELKAKDQEFELLFLPDASQTLHRLQTLLQSAQKSVKVAMFTFTHPALVQTLIDLHKRGIQVEIVLDRDSSLKTSRVACKRFQKEKMAVRVSKRQGLLHEKIAIIDDSILVGGSTNWTKAGFSANDEHLFIVSPLTIEQQEKLARFWQTTLQEAVP